MKNLLKNLAQRCGYSITKLPSSDGTNDPYSDVTSAVCKIVDIDKLGSISLSIPGMIAPGSGKFLYVLCLMQELRGDVVEIGSWQGRSSSFLARAVADSGNGRFFAIDHFKGSPGKEQFYVVGKKDLSDLRGNFENNMRRLGLWKHVNLLDMPNDEAAKKLSGQVRFLFIDGDHTKAGVEKDLQLFFPLLTKGSIVVFDDFEKGWAGLVEAVEELLAEREFERMFSYQKTLVLRV